MNFQIVRRTLGWLLIVEAIFFALPVFTAIVYGEKEVVYFLVSASLSLSVGIVCFLHKPTNNSLYAKEGFLIVSLSWILMSLFGALPFYLSGTIPSFIDALFETVSGFTTTGATIMSGEMIESASRSILMWRSFTHWLGGMGVLVFLIALLPLSGAKNMHLMKAESTGPVVSKIVPRVKQTAKILYIIYALFTAIECIMLLFGGMSFFEAITTAFSTAGTGGFGIRGDSIGSHSAYIQIVLTVFMILFSLSFTSFYLLFRKKFKEAFTTEIKVFLLIVFVSIVSITLNLYLSPQEGYSYTFGEALRHSSFNVSSIISTTGFVTENFDIWPALSKTLLVLLMFVGACAGSTGGGIKVSRIIILFKGMHFELRRMLHPRQVKKVTIDKRPIDSDVVKNVSVFLVAYILIYAVSMVIVSIDSNDLITNFTAVSATINNVGPGLSLVGPIGNYAFFSPVSKIVLIFDMLAGRLEIFPMLLLLSPATWRKH